MTVVAGDTYAERALAGTLAQRNDSSKSNISGLLTGRSAWAANTVYAQWDVVTRPNGVTYAAKTKFTSGASFDTTNWLTLGSTTVSSTVAASETTASTSIVNLTTVGPTVQLDLPSGGGFITVYGECDIQGDGTNQAQVYLIDDVDFTNAATGQIIMQRSVASLATVRTCPNLTSGVNSRVSGPLTFFLTGGVHNLSFKYKVVAGAAATFANRKLSARVL